MKKHAGLEARRKRISPDVKHAVEFSFAIANRIHEILESKGMTQRQFAEKLGKKESEVSKWMRGTHNFTTNSIVKMQGVLGEPILQVTSKQRKGVYVLKVSNGSSDHISLAVEGKQTVQVPTNQLYTESETSVELEQLCYQHN
ncbi:XRE family transcriptional regulator [Chryseotalea sanaruensis]|uniref:XRE family transcriptional regulator n=1 Tax=Chryseotalea sanaruensis TaxID=2482724 RepID=A0A401UA01_9BACT|nr:helix-turn-helix transcriptional regulator [Chryseotalea sanaruensis]GCC51748.1 XRE family transcriptional regulator [Chryseotalea sanaruensis]